MDEINKKKGVLFLIGGFTCGGVERVTIALANEFIKRGRSVVITAFSITDKGLLNTLSPQVIVQELPCPAMGKRCCEVLRELIVENNIGFVLNERCTPYSVTRFIRKATRGLDISLLAYKHNQPNLNGKITSSHGLKKFIAKIITNINTRLTYNFSDAYVLISPPFAPILNAITHSDGEKTHVIHNPFLLKPAPPQEKENLILYVGRLDEPQKRVSRVISLWKSLSQKLPSWHLEICGDGPDMTTYKKQAEGLPRISFEGKQNPIPYYARAKILLLTSDYEGYPLVLQEAQSNGAVPIVLGSYISVTDVVTDGKDGIIVPAPYDESIFEKAILELVKSPNILSQLSSFARKNAVRNTITEIGDLWDKLFSELQ